MSTFKIFNFSAMSSLNYCNLLCLRNTVKSCNEQRLPLSRKSLEKLGIPVPPKKPLTPYIKFVQNNRSKILETHPDLSPKSIIKLLAQEWSQCDPEEKKSLQKKFIKEMEVYLTEIEKYKENITEEQLNLIQKAKEKRKQVKEKYRINEKKETLGKPKKPTSAFLQFMFQNKDSKDENMKYIEWVREVAKKWEVSPEQDKEKYLEKARHDLEKYKSELLIWEENMIRQGHLDVVRSKELLVSNPKKQSRKIIE